MDREEFEKLYDRTKESVHRYIAAKCFCLDDIDDIYQNVWLAVYGALSKRPDSPPNEEAFIMLIAKRQLGRYYSLADKLKHLVSIDHAPEIKETAADTVDVEEELLGRELIDEIGALVRKKSLNSQKVFYLHYSKGLAVNEIAELLGMNESTVKKYLYSTLHEIRKLYERREKL